MSAASPPLHPRTTTGAFYRPELDALRFVAFLLVFLHHVFPRVPAKYEHHTSPAWAEILSAIANAFGFGLCLFFFLSAYLISSLLLLEIQRTGKLHLGSFFVRRVLRIWPLYSLGLAILAAISLLHHHGLTQFFYYLAICGNWYIVFLGGSENPMAPLWSISVEEQFYIVLPFALMLLRERTRVFGAAVCLFAASLAFLYWEGATHKNIDTYIWFNTGSQAIFFAAGLILATLTLHRRNPLSLLPRLALNLASWACFFIATYYCEAKRVADATSGLSVSAGFFLAMLGCAGLVYSLLDCGWKVPGVLIYLGKISYGLYVFHILSIWLLDGLIVHLLSHHAAPLVPVGLIKLASLPLTLVLAMISYHCLELPFLRLKPRFTYIPNRAD